MGAPFFKTLMRTGSIALVLGLVLLMILPRHASFWSDYVDAFTVAFCFTFMGHYVDWLLRGLPAVTEGVGPVVRVAGWFAGGLWCMVVARWLWMGMGRDLRELPGLLWGGVFLVIYELVARERSADSSQSS